MNARLIAKELRNHVPFTAFGTATGIAIMALMAVADVPASASETLFWIFHPTHVLLSALVTAAMYRLHSKGGVWQTVLVGYFGSVGNATLSDCLIPYAGEVFLDLPNRGLRLGFIEKWWLVNPLAGAGIAVAYVKPTTRFPHAGHVLLSTWASLFHMTSALPSSVSAPAMVVIALFLFLAVWVPCCTSDIVFPLLFAKEETGPSSALRALRKRTQ